jgi:glycyl-tRNA synthetase
MELEYFVKPGTDMEWFDYWEGWTGTSDSVLEENLNLHVHPKEDLKRYAKAAQL